MSIIFDIAANQICGARPYQEDAFLYTRLAVAGEENERALLVLADGAGGHAAGSLAARNTTLAFNEALTGAGELPEDALPGSFRKALDRANRAIAEEVVRSPDLDGMGCTLVAAMLLNSGLRWISVGDSNLHVVRDGVLHKQNEDHSYAGILEILRKQGQHVEPDPKLRPNMLVSAMAGFEIARIDCSEVPVALTPGDRVIVSSDGLNALADDTIAELAMSSRSAFECVRTLLKRVKGLGYSNQDNTTVIVAFVEDADIPFDGEDAGRDMRETQFNLVLSENDDATVANSAKLADDVAFED